MAQIIDQLYRNKMLAQTPDSIKKMSDEDLNTAISQLEQGRKQEMGRTIASSVGDLGNIFLQRGGLQPVRQERQRSNDVNSLILEQIMNRGSTSGDTPPGLWRDPQTGRVFKVPIEPAQEQVANAPQEQPQQIDNNVPEGMWRDPLTNKVYKTPTQATQKEIPSGEVPEGFWRDQSTGKVYRKITPDKTSATKTKAQIAATNELVQTIENNKIKKQNILEAEDALKRIPTGLGGKIQIGWMENVDPNNPILSDWQKVKMVLTDAQLLNTAKTKGAISDKEMELFAKASANNDVASISKIKPVIKKLLDLMNAEEKAQAEAYRVNFGSLPTSAEQQPGVTPSVNKNKTKSGVGYTIE